MNENVTPETEAPIEESREEELLRLQAEVRRMEVLQGNVGWDLLGDAFDGMLAEITERVLTSATRMSHSANRLDGIQSLQVDAMEKGMLKGVKAVLHFPEKFIAETKERIVMLQRVAEMKEKSDE